MLSRYHFALLFIFFNPFPIFASEQANESDHNYQEETQEILHNTELFLSSKNSRPRSRRGGARVGAGRKPKHVNFTCACGATKHHGKGRCTLCYNRIHQREERALRRKLGILAPKNLKHANFVCACGSNDYACKGLCKRCYGLEYRRKKSAIVKLT